MCPILYIWWKIRYKGYCNANFSIMEAEKELMDPTNQSIDDEFMTLFERHPHAILELEDGVIRRTNLAARRLLDVDRNQLIERRIHTLFSEDQEGIVNLVNDRHTPCKQTSLALNGDFGKDQLAEVTLLNDTNTGSERQFLMIQTVQKGVRSDSVSSDDNGKAQRASLKKTLFALQGQMSTDVVFLGQEHTGSSTTETLVSLSGDEELDTSDVQGSTREIYELVEEEFVYFRSGVTDHEDAPFLLNRLNADGFAAIRFDALDQRFYLCVVSESPLTSGSEVLDQLHHFAQKISQLLDHSLSSSDVNYRILFDHNPVPLWIYDTDTHEVLDANQAAQNVYGYSRDEFLNLCVDELHPDGQLDEFLAFQRDENSGAHVELPQKTKNGRLMKVELGSCPVTYEDASARLVSVRDVTRQKRALRKLERRLEYDQLTGLPNRSYFQQRLRERIDGSEDDEVSIGVFYLDIDNFNKINDVLGHSFGDQVLVSISERLQNCMPEKGLLARWAGDEFIGFLPDIDSTDDLEELVKQFREVLQTPFELDDRTFHLDCSIGLSLYPQDGSNPEELIGKADVAMARTREGSSSFYEYYIEGDIEETSQELKLLHDMKRAVRKNQFELFYQPFVDYDCGHVSGCEALIRWDHPERGIIQPSSFIPTAEATGLIVPIGKWVIRRACEQIAAWSEEYDQQLFISVNIAVQQIQDPDFLPHIKQTLERTGADPHLLQVELTESTIMNNLDRGRKMLGELQDMGVRIAIDDFGTGYSSLEYLMRLPVDLLKVDRSFTEQITEEPYVVELFHLIRTISERLDLDVLVEGVESREQLRKIQDQECRMFQGYLFGHPCSSKQFINNLLDGGFLDHPVEDGSYGRA